MCFLLCPWIHECNTLLLNPCVQHIHDIRLCTRLRKLLTRPFLLFHAHNMRSDLILSSLLSWQNPSISASPNSRRFARASHDFPSFVHNPSKSNFTTTPSLIASKRRKQKFYINKNRKLTFFFGKYKLSSVCSVSSVSSLRWLNTVSLTVLRALRNFTEAILASRIKDRRDLCIFLFRFSLGVSSTRTKSNERSISKNRLICHHYKVSTWVLRNKSVLRQGAYLDPTPVIPAFFFSVILLEFLLREQKTTKDQFLRTA